MNPQSPSLIRETFPVGPLQCNCTLIGDPISKKAIVVDPGAIRKRFSPACRPMA